MKNVRYKVVEVVNLGFSLQKNEKNKIKIKSYERIKNEYPHFVWTVWIISFLRLFIAQRKPIGRKIFRK